MQEQTPEAKDLEALSTASEQCRDVQPPAREVSVDVFDSGLRPLTDVRLSTGHFAR